MPSLKELSDLPTYLGISAESVVGLVTFGISSDLIMMKESATGRQSKSTGYRQ